MNNLGILDISPLIYKLYWKYIENNYTLKNKIYNNYRIIKENGEFLDKNVLNDKLFIKSLNDLMEDIKYIINIYIKNHKLTHFIIAWDSNNNKEIRQKFNNDYKNTRKGNSIIKLIKPKIKQYLINNNFKIVEWSGYEADDIINTLTKNLYNKFDKINIICQDKDLMCLFEKDKINILKLTNNTRELSTLDDDIKIKQEFKNLTANKIPIFLALCGDNADNIKGVPNIGEKTTLKILNAYDKIEDFYNDLINKPDSIINLIGKNVYNKIKKDEFMNSYNNSKYLVDLKLVPLNENLLNIETYDINNIKKGK